MSRMKGEVGSVKGEVGRDNRVVLGGLLTSSF